jgi:hypothetical protein
MLYGCYRHGDIIYLPRVLDSFWEDPETHQTYFNFNLLSPEQLEALGVFPSLETIPEYDPIFEGLELGTWSFNTDTLTFERTDLKVDRPVEVVKEDRILTIKTQCRTLILEAIDIYQQIDILWGQQPDAGYSDWIASMRAECNRCEDEYKDASSIEELKKVSPSFPEYKTP